jgi:hypothetical protein
MPPDEERQLTDPTLNIRPSIYDGLGEPSRDRLGRRQPRKLSVFTFLRAIPGLAVQFRDIPEDFWALDVNDEGYSEAAISCPCGATPRVELGTLQECSCERFFLFVGTKVMVANSPASRQRAELRTPAEP